MLILSALICQLISDSILLPEKRNPTAASNPSHRTVLLDVVPAYNEPHDPSMYKYYEYCLPLLYEISRADDQYLIAWGTFIYEL